jgi:hypothetical protein
MNLVLENLPLTLVFKKSRQNLDLLSQYYGGVFIKATNSKNIAIPIHELLDDVPSRTHGTLILGNAQTPRKVFNHANLKEILIRKDIHPLLAIEYIKEILK